jgi:hypothetical protein
MATPDEKLIEKMAALWVLEGGDAEGFAILKGRVYLKIEEIKEKEEN